MCFIPESVKSRAKVKRRIVAINPIEWRVYTTRAACKRGTFVVFRWDFMAIEVFRTNVETECEAELVLTVLGACFEGYKINFDLDDVDRILRVSTRQRVAVENLMAMVKALGFDVEVLPDLPNSMDSLFPSPEERRALEESVLRQNPNKS